MQLVAVMLCATLMGCAQSTKTWVSDPQKRMLERPAFTIEVMPKIHNQAGYNVFFLTLENQGTQPIAIDWNRSLYLFNGKRAGRFVFAGIEPTAVKTASFPLEVIQPGERLEKRFGPFKTIAYAPIRERKQASDPGLFFGLLPEGENTVSLALLAGGQSARYRFAFHISTQVTEP
jgi:hypothetical protein